MQPSAADARAVLESLGLSVVDCGPRSWQHAYVLRSRSTRHLDRSISVADHRPGSAIEFLAYGWNIWWQLRNWLRPAGQAQDGPWLIRRGLQCSYGIIELPAPANDLGGQ